MSKKNTIRYMRRLAVVSAVMMNIHVGMLLLGINEVYTEILMVCGGFVLVWLMSKALGFCLAHRLLVGYSYSVMVCIWWQRHSVGFGEYLDEARWVEFCVGIIIFGILYGCKR